MKKSVSVPDEVFYKTMDLVYVKNGENPKCPTTFSQVVTDALILLLNTWKTGVT